LSGAFPRKRQCTRRSIQTLCGNTELEMAESLRKVFQIKVSLIGAKPPIWRRLLVTSSTGLSAIHNITQIAMGWTDSHLHQFIVGNTRYGVPDPDWDDGTIPEASMRVGDLLKKPKDWIIYEYDFGDSWGHRIELEKILSFTPDIVMPVCTGGRKCCPPEDVGGVWGYSEFLEVYRDNNHPEHEEMLEWVGEYFDPENFDLDEVNEILSEEHGTA